MKKRFLSLLLVICATLFGVLGITACDGGQNPTLPQKLSTPVVTLTENVASWEADENADKFEISLSGNLSYVENTVTSKTLSNGETFKIRAVGDGISYKTSAWSNSVTYTASGSTPQATKLSTPTVRISATGLASWTASAGASGYAYKLNDGAETPTTATSLQLSDGQSIAVKAVGDGVNYTDSDYSAAQTYTAGAPTPTAAPTYLGITASAETPSSSEIPDKIAPMSLRRYSTRVSLEEALRAYLSDSNNALGDPAPTESNYELYSAIGNTVYIQIWLDNPDQNTILSLKLNGTKHQSGGTLQSFFIQDGASYLNCVYVAITIPANSYNEIAYEVTEIEYVEGTNISQDGKAVLIDEDNDTVTVGLPYQQALPTATISDVTTTATTLSFNVNVTDSDSFVNLVGGWLRVVLFDQNREILAQQKLTNGNNTVTFQNLSAETYYSILPFVLGDRHDGNGVYVHSLGGTYAQTQSVITCNATSQILLNENTGKYYPNIKVEATLSDASFTFTKVEVVDTYNWEEILYTASFDGSIDISENILCGGDYRVKVYYKNSSNVEQYHEDYVSANYLDEPGADYKDYGLLDDALLEFDFGDRKCNFDNLTIKIFDEDSAQYLAEDALALIRNPNLIEELQTQLNSMDRTHDGYFELGLKINRLQDVQQRVERYYSTLSEQDWEAELAKGIYTYEYVFGQDEAFFKGANNKYYVVLDSYQSKRVNDYAWQYILTADVDRSNGEAVQENKQIASGYFDIEPAISDRDFLFAASDEDYNELFTVDENNVLYLEVMSRDASGNESYRALGYVNQIVLTKDNEIVQVLWSQEAPNHTIDEAAWLANIKQAVQNGNDVNSAFPLGELQPITFDLDDVDLSAIEVGNYVIKYTYKMYGKTYTQDNPYNVGGYLEYATAARPLPKASIKINTNSPENFGEMEVVIPESVEGGYWNSYTIEVRDADEQPVATYTQDNYWEMKLSLYYSARIKLNAIDGIDYYTDGEWSEWFTCTPVKYATPSNFEQEYTREGVIVRWGYVNGADKYIYVLNGGEETETYAVGVSKLKKGDTLKVKAVLAEDSPYYLESDYSEIYTVTDDRTPLATPIVTVGNSRLSWQAIENAEYYNILNVSTGNMWVENYAYTACNVDTGNIYVVIAVPTDYETYCASYSEEIKLTGKLDTPTITIDETGTVTFSSYNVGAKVTYTYVINDGEEQTTKSEKGIMLEAGDSIKVKVSCSGYEDSEWSETVTYTKQG